MTQAFADLSLYSNAKLNYKIVVGIDPRVDDKYKSAWAYGTVFQMIRLEPSSPVYYFQESNGNGNPSYSTIEYGDLFIYNYGLYLGYEMLLSKGFIVTPLFGFNSNMMSYSVKYQDINDRSSSQTYYGGGFYFDANIGFETRLKITPGFGLVLDYAYHYLIETSQDGQVTGGVSLKYYDMTAGIYFNLGPDTW